MYFLIPANTEIFSLKIQNPKIQITNPQVNF